MTRPLTVIKVGGSLLDWADLPHQLVALLAHPTIAPTRPLVIAGGGAMVDVIRHLDAIHRFGEATAHALALQTLDLTARLLARIGRSARLRVVESLRQAADRWAAGEVPVLAPRRELGRLERRSGTPLPQSWNLTSDSIAAQLSVAAGASTLVLLKSADLPPSANRQDAARLALIDPLFPTISQPLQRVLYANLRRPGPLVFQNI
ncbi:MAG: hypothetical protein KatS3mg108_2869 [Isosphaeraceae bacterium]|jgi:aspartokinase-like uncharacterized kinase|nr:MAG: hypothetical protein KatS3mg108_2869 [Isosphaeraceae bacterium]